MSRNPDIEKILNAWWELDSLLPASRAKAETTLNQLLDAVVAKSDAHITRDQIKDYLWPQYKEFRQARRKASIVQVAQSVMGKS